MTERLAAALQAVLRSLRDPHVFRARWGEPFTRRQVRARCQREQRAAGAGIGTFHWLRLTFCSDLAMAGVRVGTLRKPASHEEIGTSRKYMHLAPDARDDAIALLRGTSAAQNMKKPAARAG